MILLLDRITNAPSVGFDMSSYFEATKVDGLVLEFGVARGDSIRKIAGGFPDKTVYGFDSFEGLPEDWRPSIQKGAFSCDVPTDLPENVTLVKGWFEDTLVPFLEEHEGPVAFLHVDCDIYSATKTIFDNLKDRIVDGTIIIFDEIFGYDGYEHHEFKAFNEYLVANDMNYECIGIHQHEKAGFRVFK